MGKKRISGIFCIFLLTGLSLVGLNGVLTSLTENNSTSVTLTLISVILIAVVTTTFFVCLSAAVTTTFFVCFSEDNEKGTDKDEKREETKKPADDKKVETKKPADEKEKSK